MARGCKQRTDVSGLDRKRDSLLNGGLEETREEKEREKEKER